MLFSEGVSWTPHCKCGCSPFTAERGPRVRGQMPFPESLRVLAEQA